VVRRRKTSPIAATKPDIHPLTANAFTAGVPTTLLGMAAFIDGGGGFSVAPVPSYGVVATAHIKNSTIAMLKQKSGETLLELLDRLEHAIIEAIATGYVVDDVNLTTTSQSVV